MQSTNNLAAGDGSVPTLPTLQTEENKTRKKTRLSQQEYQAWWPFDRLDPSLFPKAQKQTDPLDDVEESPI